MVRTGRLWTDWDSKGQEEQAAEGEGHVEALRMVSACRTIAHRGHGEGETGRAQERRGFTKTQRASSVGNGSHPKEARPKHHSRHRLYPSERDAAGGQDGPSKRWRD